MSRARTQPSSRADSQHNRTRILDAAEALWPRGELTINGLAQMTGLARTTIYRHFGDLAAVRNAVVARSATALMPRLLSPLADGDDRPLSDLVDQFSAAIVAIAEERRALLAVLAGQLESVARDAVTDEPLTAVIADLRRRGQHDSPVPDAWLAASVRALCLHAVLDERPASEVQHDLAQSLHQLLALDRD